MRSICGTGSDVVVILWRRFLESCARIFNLLERYLHSTQKTRTPLIVAHLRSMWTSQHHTVNRSLWWVIDHFFGSLVVMTSGVVIGLEAFSIVVVCVMGHNRSSSMQVIFVLSFRHCWNRTALGSLCLCNSPGGITNLHNTPDPDEKPHGAHGCKGTKPINSAHGVQMRRSNVSMMGGLHQFRIEARFVKV